MNVLGTRQTLAERDRWAADTQAALYGGARAVIRLSARMPASLRARGLADRPLGRGAAAFEAECRRLGLSLMHLGPGRGALGPWVLWTSDNDPFLLKRAAICVEDGSIQGQLLDLDVFSQEGPISRSLLGLPPRLCVVCGRPAAVCAGRAIHTPSTTEAAFLYLLEPSSGLLRPGSPDGNAVGVQPPLNI
jgi:holo-ACP synthase / triphosphoribosyl-dephospho-CoA synthase